MQKVERRHVAELPLQQDELDAIALQQPERDTAARRGTISMYILLSRGHIIQVAKWGTAWRSGCLPRLRRLRRPVPPDLRSTAPRCMSARPFLDTNVLVYALAHDDHKTPSAEALLSAPVPSLVCKRSSRRVCRVSNADGEGG